MRSNDGSRRVTEIVKMNPLFERREIPCPVCGGSGKNNHENCLGVDQWLGCVRCNGTGTVLESHEAYEKRLVRMIEYIALEATKAYCNYCDHYPKCSDIQACVDADIQEAFTVAKEAK
jgi:hypothetical protein